LTVDQNISSRINLMRILLISGIVFVHVPFDPPTSPFAVETGVFNWLRVFLGDSFFRIGVPCLSAISGYLLFRRGMESFAFGKTVRSKTETVLAPFLIWNLGLLVVVLLVQAGGIGIGYFPDLWHSSIRELLSLAFAAEAFPINLPLYFLRDLFVCVLLSPILAYFVRRMPAITCALLFLLAILPDVTIGLVLKKSILFSFTFGIFLALHRIDLKALDRYAPLGVTMTVVAAAVLASGLYQTGPDFPFWLELARNTLSIVGAAGFWLLSALLIRTAPGRRLANTGSLSFWIFCGHFPVLILLWMVWNRIAGDAVYPLFYVGAVVLTFAVLTISNALTSRYLPGFYKVLTGSRGRKTASQQTSRAALAAHGVERPVA
jgi:Predicted acyltransferases